jgi:hypothetical protein
MRIARLFLILALCAGAASADDLGAEIAKNQETAAVAFEKLFEKVRSIEIISLDPNSGWDAKEDEKASDKARLQHWLIVGRATIDSPLEIAKIKEEAARGIRTSDGGAMACFDPRHALSFKSGATEITVLICFHCLQGTVTGSSHLRYFATSSDPSRYFNQLFKAHGLRLMP